MTSLTPTDPTQAAPGGDGGSHHPDPAAGETATLSIVVPDHVSMLALLGAHDEMLRTIERAFPTLDVHVRGNEITARGPQPERDLLERLFDELLVIVGAGQPPLRRRGRALGAHAPRP